MMAQLVSCNRNTQHNSTPRETRASGRNLDNSALGKAVATTIPKMAYRRFFSYGTLAARGGSRTEPFGVDSGRMQGAAKRRILEVFKRAATQTRESGRALLDRSGRGRFGTLPGFQCRQTAQNPPERRRGDFHHGLPVPPARISTSTWQ